MKSTHNPNIVLFKKKCRELTIINKAEKLLLKEKLNDA